MAKLRREVKNVFYNYTDAEVKVREATSNDPWGPSSTLMAELAEYTFHTQAYNLVMGMLWKRLNDHGKNWRHVFKSLVVLEYLIKSGSGRVVRQCRENLFSIETLKDFQFVDKEGKDQGNTVREKAKAIVALIKDEQRLKEERERAIQARERQQISGFGSDSPQGRRSKSPRLPDNSESRYVDSGSIGSSSTVRFEPHMDQSRPSRREEEDLQLQLALKMSKEQADEEDKLRKQEEESLRLALEMSRKETGEESGGLAEENGDGEEEQTEESGGNLLLDLGGAGIGDPWAKPSEPPPPSYDVITSPKNDPWSSVGNNSDPFKTADPFASVPMSSNDPWLPSSTTTAAGSSSSAVPSITTGPFDLPPLNISAPVSSMPVSSMPVSSMPVSSAGAAPFIMSSLDSQLPPLQPVKSNEPSPTAQRKQRVEESFLGDTAGLVNLDSLTAPLPPASSLGPNNPFGMTILPGQASPKLSNPFEANKPAAPSLSQLKQSQTPMFDPLPPPILPTGNQGSGFSTSSVPASSQSFNPFT